MRTLWSTLLLVLLLTPCGHAQTVRTVSRTFDLAAGGSVTVDTYKGRVDIQTWDRDEARVEVRIEGEEQAPVENTKIRFQASSDRLEIETDYDELEANRKFLGLFRLGSIDRPSTEYTITIPRTSDVVVDTYSAATNVTSLEGELRYDGYSAPLTVDRLTGSLRADTYSGSIDVRRIDGTLTADTYSGRLRADSISGAVEFSTYSGSATLGFVTLADDCTFNSFSGSVTATLPAGAGAVIETKADALDSEVPLRLESVGDDHVRATLGEGGPRVRFDTFSGTISLRSR